MHLLLAVSQAAKLPVDSGVNFQQLEQGLLELGQRIDEDMDQLIYFVGVGAIDTVPQSILGGDRNLGPGTTPDTEYGFSPANGKGNDVIITGPVCWSLKMHSHGSPTGAGNILLGDGSAQQTISGGLYTPGGVSTSDSLYEYWVKNALAEKAAHNKTTNLAGLRLIFP
jgi:hypothetical protein